MSFTLLTFANSFPDMVTSILMAKEKEEGPYVSLAGLFATFIFQTTVTIAFVIFNSDFEVEVIFLYIYSLILQVHSKFFFKEIIAVVIITSTFLIYGIFGWISGVIMIIFSIFYIAYFIASWMIAKQTKTIPNFKQFIDFEDSDQSSDENVDFKRNLFVEKIQKNEHKNSIFQLNSLSVEQNVLSHVSKIKV